MQVIDLGYKDYKETLEFQYKLIEQRQKKQIPNTLILVEHPHVITLGRKTNPANVLVKDLPIFQVERGGDVTYHGPGQLIGYPIFDIKEQPDIGKFLRNLEQILIEVLQEYHLNASRKDKYTGVWVNDLKIASIGVSFKNWVSFHGFSLNVTTDLSYFFKINPCGLESSIMTSMEQLLNNKVDFKLLKSKIISKFNSILKD